MKIFIPIKENSVRVPKKNFRLLGKKPLYIYVLEKLSEHEVFVDTDSEEVLKGCESLKHVLAYKRRKDLIGDDVSVSLLIQNCIEEFNIRDEVMCQMHVTSPFLDTDTLEQASNILSADIDSVSSVNLYKSRFWKEYHGSTIPLNHNPLELKKTQDLWPILEENSLFYIFKPVIVLKTGNRVSSRHEFYETRKLESMDIDTMEDWAIVELIYKGLES